MDSDVHTNDGGVSPLRDIFKLAVPAILNNLIRQFFQLINLHFVGRLQNPTIVAAVGLGTMTANIVGMAFFMGFNSVLDMMVS